jgi:hypothetical protein
MLIKWGARTLGRQPAQVRRIAAPAAVAAFETPPPSNTAKHAVPLPLFADPDAGSDEVADRFEMVALIGEYAAGRSFLETLRRQQCASSAADRAATAYDGCR